DVTLAFLQGCLNHPHPVQFIAGQVLVDVTWLDDVRVAQVVIDQLVGVVGNIQLLLAHQFPVVAVRCTVDHVEVIGRTHTVGRGTRAVIGNLGCTTYTTLTGVVDPRQTRLLHLVDGFVHQQYVTSQTRGGNDLLLEVVQNVLTLLGIIIRQCRTGRNVFLESDNRVRPVCQRRGLRDYPLHGAA